MLWLRNLVALAAFALSFAVAASATMPRGSQRMMMKRGTINKGRMKALSTMMTGSSSSEDGGSSSQEAADEEAPIEEDEIQDTTTQKPTDKEAPIKEDEPQDTTTQETDTTTNETSVQEPTNKETATEEANTSSPEADTDTTTQAAPIQDTTNPSEGDDALPPCPTYTFENEDYSVEIRLNDIPTTCNEEDFLRMGLLVEEIMRKKDQESLEYQGESMNTTFCDAPPQKEEVGVRVRFLRAELSHRNLGRYSSIFTANAICRRCNPDNSARLLLSNAEIAEEVCAIADQVKTEKQIINLLRAKDKDRICVFETKLVADEERIAATQCQEARKPESADLPEEEMGHLVTSAENAYTQVMGEKNRTKTCLEEAGISTTDIEEIIDTIEEVQQDMDNIKDDLETNGTETTEDSSGANEAETTADSVGNEPTEDTEVDVVEAETTGDSVGNEVTEDNKVDNVEIENDIGEVGEDTPSDTEQVDEFIQETEEFLENASELDNEIMATAGKLGGWSVDDYEIVVQDTIKETLVAKYGTASGGCLDRQPIVIVTYLESDSEDECVEPTR